MIYLDTSAFVKLYLSEDGSAQVHGTVVAQSEPLPVWHLMELEFYNALRFKVFLSEMKQTASFPSISAAKVRANTTVPTWIPPRSRKCPCR